MQIPKCMMCKHFIESDDKKIPTCKAFPELIPEEIMWNEEEKECKKGYKFESVK